MDFRLFINYIRLHLNWAMSGITVPKLPRVSKPQAMRLTRIGSEYGGWIVPIDEVGEQCVVLSCGVGEDISFDLALASQTNAHLIFVDPTPRAVQFLEKFSQALKDSNYLPDDSRGLGSDLTGLEESQFTFVHKAVSYESGEMTFYSPKNQDHVSYSLANLQGTDPASAIKVEVETVSEICEALLLRPDVVKLDIEGVAAKTISKMFSDRVYPKVILAEFEELMLPSSSNKAALMALSEDLESNGYSLIARDRVYNFTFVRS